MAEKKTALEKEWESFLRREKKLLRKYGRRKEPLLERKLQKAVPDGLSEKLEAAFYRAFCMILENGTAAIEKTFPKDRMEAEYKTREYAGTVYPVRKNLAAGRKLAARNAAAGVAGACAEGAVLGLLGIGLPDIPIFWPRCSEACIPRPSILAWIMEKAEEQVFLLELLALSSL